MANAASKVLGASMALALSLSLLSLAGCGRDGPAPKEEPAHAAQEQQAVTKEAENKEEPKEPALHGALDEKMGTLVVNEPDRQVYEVVAADSEMAFYGAFSGTQTGRMSVKLLDANKELYKTVDGSASGVVRSDVEVEPGETYYVSIEWTQGNWTLEWEGAAAA